MNTMMKLICVGVAVAWVGVAADDGVFQAKPGKALQSNVFEFSSIISGEL